MKPMTVQCPSVETLTQLLDDTLHHAAELEQHLLECSVCRLQLDQLTDSEALRAYRPASPNECQWDFLDPPVRPDDLGKIGQWQIEKVIGRGGNGIVFCAYDQNLSRTVAIKVLTRENEPHSAARFQREIQTAAGLRSDHIVAIYSSGTTESGRPFLVMPLIDGESLKERLIRGPLDSKQAAAFCRQIALGLQLTHDAGLIHRDVKPANILIEQKTDQAKLTDFGLVHGEAIDTLTRANVICGTPEYMSPEQAEGHESLTSASDVYSLGITLFECLTGTPPFRGLPLQVLKQHADTTPLRPSKLNPHIPGDLETICLKSIAKLPSARYESAQHFADDLERFLENKPIHARETPWHQRLRMWCGRNRRLAVSLALLAATFLMGTVLSTSMWIRSEYNAELARKRADQLDIQSRKLQSTNAELESASLRTTATNRRLREALDSFFTRALRDRSGGAQLSVEFRAQMVGQLKEHYSAYLQENPEAEARLEVCEDVDEIVELLLNQTAGNLATVLATWNLEQLQPLVEKEHPKALWLAAKASFHSYEAGNMLKRKFPDDKHLDNNELHDNRFNDAVAFSQRAFAQKQMAAPELAAEIDQFQLRMLASQVNRSQLSVDQKRQELQRYLQQFEKLCSRHPNLVTAFYSRSRIARKIAKLGTPLEEARWRGRSIEIQLQMLAVEKSLGKPDLWTRQQIAVARTWQGIAYLRGGKRELAEQAFQDSIQRCRELIRDYPAFRLVRADLAETLVIQMNLLWQDGDVESYLDMLRQATYEFKTAIRLDANSWSLINRLGYLQFLQAKRLAGIERFEEAAAVYESMLEDQRVIFETPVSSTQGYLIPGNFIDLRDKVKEMRDFYQQQSNAERVSQLNQEIIAIETAHKRFLEQRGQEP